MANDGIIYILSQWERLLQMNKQILSNRLRDRFYLPKVYSDEVVLEITKGSILRALIELDLSVDDLKSAFANSFKRIKLNVLS